MQFRIHTLSSALVAAAAALGAGAPPDAQGPPPSEDAAVVRDEPEEEDGGSIGAGTSFRSLDNDAFTHSDDQYTHGLTFSYLSPYLESFEDGPLPDGLGHVFDGLSLFADKPQRFVSHSFSQRLFTPGDLLDPNLIENDIPYSALLYLTMSVSAQDEDSLDSLSFDAGWTGPLALGEESQKFFHDLLDSKEPLGWDNQIENEPLIGVRWEHRERLARFGRGRGFNGDLLANTAVAVGNIQTRATLGATARAGLRVPDNFHIPAPFLADETIGLRPYTKKRPGFSLYGFASVSAEAIANAIYLDGNTFRDSHSVDYDRLVGRGSIGLVANVGALFVTVSLEKATIPYDNPRNESSESYGRIGLTWDL